MFDLNDVEPIQSGELLSDGSFAKVTMTIRAGGVDGPTEIDKALLKASGRVLAQVIAWRVRSVMESTKMMRLPAIRDARSG